MTPLVRLLRLLAPHKGTMAATTVLSVLVCGGLLIIPAGIKSLLADAAAGKAGTPGLWIELGGGLTVALVAVYLVYVLMFNLGRTITAELRTACLARLIAAPMQYHYDNAAGALLERLRGSLADIERFITYHLLSVAVLFFMLAGGLSLMAFLSWKLTLVVLAVIPALALALRALLSRSERSLKKGDEALEGIAAHFLQALLSIAGVKAYNAEERELEHFRRKQDELLAHRRREARVKAFAEPLSTAVVISAILLVLVAGSWLIARRELTVEALMAFLLYFWFLAPQARILSQTVIGFQQASAAVGRIDSILAVPVERDRPGAVELPRALAGLLEIDAVTFAYPGRGAALDGLTLAVRPKESVGIVGASGAGKTTLMNLLLRFDAPQGGSIRIDGIDIAGVTAASLRRAIAVVPQEILLADDTVMENVRYGSPSASDEAVMAACRLAQADDFISALPEGYLTNVGERGSKLSGGERQRIAIARALLKNAPILVLDEATSALDGQTEQLLRRSIAAAMADRTTIIIAHRLSTVIHLPRIAVLADGRMIDEGTHDELMASCAYYRELFAAHGEGEPAGAARAANG